MKTLIILLISIFLISGCVIVKDKKVGLQNIEEDKKALGLEEDRTLVITPEIYSKSYKNQDNNLEYSVIEGDTLWDLAEKYYGDSMRWRDITLLDGKKIGNHYQLQEGKDILVPNYSYEVKNLKGDYYIENGVVKFRYLEHSVSLDDADPESFVVLCETAKKAKSCPYAKDNKNLYYKDNIVDSINVDLESIEVLNKLYLKDKNNVYCKEFRDKFATGISILEGADPSKFFVIYTRVHPSRYARDNGTLYKNCEKTSVDLNSTDISDVLNLIEDKEFSMPSKADPESYEYLGYELWRDKNGVYRNYVVIEGADQDTIKVIDRYYLRDDKYFYYVNYDNKNFSFENADYATFIILGTHFTKDKNSVYFKGAIIDGADPASFEYFNMFYQKDKNAVYFKGAIIDGADPASFVVIEKEIGRAHV